MTANVEYCGTRIHCRGVSRARGSGLGLSYGDEDRREVGWRTDKQQGIEPAQQRSDQVPRVTREAHRFSSPMTRVQRSFILPMAWMHTLGASCHETGLYDGRPSSMGVSTGPARKVYRGE